MAASRKPPVASGRNPAAPVAVRCLDLPQLLRLSTEGFAMGGHQIPGMGTGDDGYDEEGYDESQRAEILEATRDGPSDGLILTDLEPDLGDSDTEDEPIDELDMDSEEVGEASAEVDADEDDLDEDELQDDFDADTVGKDADGDDTDDDLTDADDAALRP
jgi:hypothetical protein